MSLDTGGDPTIHSTDSEETHPKDNSRLAYILLTSAQRVLSLDLSRPNRVMTNIAAINYAWLSLLKAFADCHIECVNAHGLIIAGSDPLGDESSLRIVKMSLNCLRPTNPRSTNRGTPRADASTSCINTSEALMADESSWEVGSEKVKISFPDSALTLICSLCHRVFKLLCMKKRTTRLSLKRS